MDVYPSLTKAVEKMPNCKCGHAAIEHWHGGPVKSLEIEACGIRRCRCRKYVAVEKMRERIQ